MISFLSKTLWGVACLDTCLDLICQVAEEVANCPLDQEIGLIGHYGLLVRLLVVIKQQNNAQDYAFQNLAMVMTLKLVLVLICPCVLLLGPLGLPVLKLVDMLPDTVQDKMKWKVIRVRIYQNAKVIFKYLSWFHMLMDDILFRTLVQLVWMVNLFKNLLWWCWRHDTPENSFTTMFRRWRFCLSRIQTPNQKMWKLSTL